MKNLILTVIFICTCNVAKSQLHQIYYTPFFQDTPLQNQQQTQPSKQTQILRATAYQTDYTKIPIQVTVTTYVYPVGGSYQEGNVTSYYLNNGFGGQWENCMSGVTVQQCQSIFGNEMEKSFMFKANLPMIGWIYFDL